MAAALCSCTSTALAGQWSKNRHRGRKSPARSGQHAAGFMQDGEGAAVPLAFKSWGGGAIEQALHRAGVRGGFSERNANWACGGSGLTMLSRSVIGFGRQKDVILIATKKGLDAAW